MSFLSKINPSTKSIQKEYVEKRQRALYANDPAKTERVRKKVEQLMALYKVTGDWHDHYLKVHRGLQDSHLTINLEAGNWFARENRYESYGQMYERSTGADGKMRLQNNDAKNPAVPRAMADDLVTIPDEWANAHPFSQRKRLHNALSASGVSLQEVVASKKGVSAGNAALAHKLKGDDASGYGSTNSRFKATAKQVFAALNYGMRPHGSSTYYGFSYLVLNPELKKNAIYYPGDTFYIATRGTSSQATFNTIGALLESALVRPQLGQGGLGQQIWESCHDFKSLADTEDGDLLVEAHIFKKLKLSEDVQSLVLSRQRKSSQAPWSNLEWDLICKNATTWCARNGIRLTFASP